MTKVIKIKRGLNIRLKGEAEKIVEQYNSELFSIKPCEFRLFQPKLTVSVGDEVQIGTPLAYDKKNPRIVLTSPVSGQVAEIRRGEKRLLEHIVIKNNNKHDRIGFEKTDLDKLDREMIIDRILKSGMWPSVRQRPYAVIANPNTVPDAIFISAFDTSPLAPDISFIMKHHSQEMFQAGINVLKKLTKGEIYLNVHVEQDADMFLRTKNVTINRFDGVHPASNIGVQIHHIRPIVKGDNIWYIDPQDIVIIGKLFSEGKLDFRKIFAITGSEFNRTFYFNTVRGACVNGLVSGNLIQENTRIISGNVLTGKKIEKDGFLGYYDNVITAIPEGDYYEFLGWALPGFKKFSVSRTFFSWLFRNRLYALDTNKHGDLRAFVMTGEYEKVFPMKIMPVQLLKAIIIKDFDLMEQLGIYEVAEEDFALCEVICTSKIEAQSIVRQGIDFMIKETS